MPTKYVKLFNADNPNSPAESCVYEEISECPICHCKIVPVPLTGSYTKWSDLPTGSTEFVANILFHCPSCRDTFLVKYMAVGSATPSRTSRLQGQWPLFPESIDLSDAVKKMSPMFAITYTEAGQAEAQNLTEIAGCGYRKAVEYLVKDYLCSRFIDDEETIKKEPLGMAIQRIDDPRIKTLAQRSVWIGNDETHYIRKHENLDIEDMKRFISAMLHYIDAELALEEALAIEPIK